jgi:hypothetical protein
MITMAEETTPSRLGSILTTVGYLGLFLCFRGAARTARGVLGDVLSFFRSTLIFPIILIFAGRAINRRARRSTLDEALDRQPATAGPSSSPTPRRRRPASIRSKPVPSAERTTEAVHRREMEDMAEMHQGARGDEPGDHLKAIEELLEKEMSYRPRTSEEMIAEAHRRWNRED